MALMSEDMSTRDHVMSDTASNHEKRLAAEILLKTTNTTLAASSSSSSFHEQQQRSSPTSINTSIAIKLQILADAVSEQDVYIEDCVHRRVSKASTIMIKTNGSMCRTPIAPDFLMGATIDVPGPVISRATRTSWRVSLFEYLSGCTLAAMNGCETNTAYQIYGNIENSVIAMWNTGVAHADLHPWNVIVLHDHTVRLIDFGLAITLPRSILCRLRKELRNHINAIIVRQTIRKHRYLYMKDDLDDRIAHVHVHAHTKNDDSGNTEQHDECNMFGQSDDLRYRSQSEILSSKNAFTVMISRARSANPEEPFNKLCLQHLRRVMSQRGIQWRKCHFDGNKIADLRDALPLPPPSDLAFLRSHDNISELTSSCNQAAAAEALMVKKNNKLMTVTYEKFHDSFGDLTPTPPPTTSIKKTRVKM